MPEAASANSMLQAPAESLDVRAAADGTVSVHKLRVVPFSTEAEIDTLLASGSSRRHTHGTLMNATSSRSHLVLTLYTTCRSSRDGTEQKGRLHLVDLAGSERVGKSGVVGEQLKEAQNINKSLSSLEQVMLALQAKQQNGGGNGASASKEVAHVPYRNSKLTLLLSDALGAKGACAKTLMIMQVSPSPSSISETKRTLAFGERCQAVCLGAVRRAAASSGTCGGRTARQSEAAGKDEERAAKLQVELLEARKHAKESEQRAKAAEQRAETLNERLKEAHAMVERLKAADPPRPTPREHKPAVPTRHATRSVGAATARAELVSTVPLAAASVDLGATASTVRGSTEAVGGIAPSIASSIVAKVAGGVVDDAGDAPWRVVSPGNDDKTAAKGGQQRRSFPRASPLTGAGEGAIDAWVDTPGSGQGSARSSAGSSAGSGGGQTSPRRSSERSPRFTSSSSRASTGSQKGGPSPLQPRSVNSNHGMPRASPLYEEKAAAASAAAGGAADAPIEAAHTHYTSEAASAAYRKAYEELFEAHAHKLPPAEGGRRSGSSKAAPAVAPNAGKVARPRATGKGSAEGSAGENAENDPMGTRTNSMPVPALRGVGGRESIAPPPASRYALRPKTSRAASASHYAATQRPVTANGASTARWR